MIIDAISNGIVIDHISAGKAMKLYNILGLDDTLTKLHIDDTHFEQMAQKACKGNTIAGFKTLTPKDVENIYRMCL